MALGTAWKTSQPASQSVNQSQNQNSGKQTTFVLLIIYRWHVLVREREKEGAGSSQSGPDRQARAKSNAVFLVGVCLPGLDLLRINYPQLALNWIGLGCLARMVGDSLFGWFGVQSVRCPSPRPYRHLLSLFFLFCFFLLDTCASSTSGSSLPVPVPAESLPSLHCCLNWSSGNIRVKTCTRQVGSLCLVAWKRELGQRWSSTTSRLLTGLPHQSVCLPQQQQHHNFGKSSRRSHCPTGAAAEAVMVSSHTPHRDRPFNMNITHCTSLICITISPLESPSTLPLACYH